MKEILKRNVSKVLIVLLFVTALIPFSLAHAGEEFVLEIGIPNLPVEITMVELGESIEETTDGSGSVAINIYEKIKNYFKWDETNPTDVPETLTINYDINKQDAITPQERVEKGGNGRYSGIKGVITITKDKSAYQGRYVIDSSGITEYVFLEGTASSVDGLAANIPVEISYSKDDGSQGVKTVITDEAGLFSSYPEILLGKVTKITFPDSDNYYAKEVLQQDFTNPLEILLEEKWEIFPPEVFLQGIINGYAKNGTYKISVKDSTISKDKEGTFEGELELTTGVEEKIYAIKNGKVSKPYKLTIQLDNEAPTLKEGSLKETEGTDIHFGDKIYTNKAADITLEIEDNKSGPKTASIISKTADGTEKVYNYISQAGQQYNFLVEKTESQVLYLKTEDNLGNTAEFLLRETDEKSTLYMEEDKPEIVITADGENQNSWYSNDVTFTISVKDSKSGIRNISATIEGESTERINKTFDTETKEEKVTVVLTKAEVKAILNSTNTYTIKVTATDNCGNIKEEKLDVKILIEKPVVTLSGITEGKFYNVPPTLTATSDDAEYQNGSKFVITLYKEDILIETKEVNSVKETNYTPQISENGTYKICVKKISASGLESDEEQVSFKLDKIAPIVGQIELEGKNNNGWYSSDVIIKTTASDEFSALESISVSVNGEVLITKTDKLSDKGDITYTLTEEDIKKLKTSDCKYTIVITAKDKAGNSNSETKTCYILLGKPEVTISNITSNAFYNKKPTLYAASNDEQYQNGSKFIVKTYREGNLIETKEYKNVNSISHLPNAEANGNYKVTVQKMSSSGIMSDIKEVTFNLDIIKPKIAEITTKEAANNNGWYNSSVTIKSSSTDEFSGIKSISLFVNGSELFKTEKAGSFEYVLTKDQINLLGKDDCGYQVKILATDISGNVNSIEKTLYISLEEHILSIGGIEDNTHTQVPPTLKIKTNDKNYDAKGARITAKIFRNGEPISSKNFDNMQEATISSSEFKNDGKYEIRASYTSSAGNISKTAVIKFVLDRAAPQITIAGASEGEYYSTLRNIEISVSETNYEYKTVSVEIVKDLGGKKAEITSSYKWNNSKEKEAGSMNFAETGTYSITVTAKDRAGNSQSKQLTFTVDTSLPQVKISGVNNGSMYGYEDTVIPVITYSDDYIKDHTITVTKNGENFYPNIKSSVGDGVTTFETFAKSENWDGIYTFTATVTDKAGNTAKDSATFTVNRFGSKFTENNNIGNYNGKSFRFIDSDIYMEELNLGELKDINIQITRDGERLPVNLDMVKPSKSGPYNVFKHVLPGTLFKQEGVYTVNIISKDDCNNESESQNTYGLITFAIDQTRPIISTKGVTEKILNESSREITVLANDNISKNCDVRVYIRNDEQKLLGNETDGSYKFTVSEGMNQKILIVATDDAGNRTEYEVVMSLTGNKFLYLLYNYWYGLLIIPAAIIIIFLVKKKKKEEDEVKVQQ